MTASVKAMLQTLIDADLKSTGEVSQGTKEAAQAQGFTIAGDGTLEQAKAPQEAAYRLESGEYLYIQTSETAITRCTVPTTKNWTEASLTIPTCPLRKPEKKSLPSMSDRLGQ